MSEAQAGTPVAKLAFKLDRKDGAPRMTRDGDGAFLLDAKAGDAKTRGDGDNLFVPIPMPNGGTFNLPLRRNGYQQGKADVESLTLEIRVAGVTQASTITLGGAFDPMAAAKSGDLAGLTKFYAALPGMTAKQAASAATAAIKAAK